MIIVSIKLNQRNHGLSINVYLYLDMNIASQVN